MPPKYRLKLGLEIAACDERGYVQDRGLRLDDEVILSAENFMEIAGVLAKFHELAETIKDQQKTRAELDESHPGWRG